MPRLSKVPRQVDVADHRISVRVDRQLGPSALPCIPAQGLCELYEAIRGMDVHEHRG
jgi:hypothetical protein